MLLNQGISSLNDIFVSTTSVVVHVNYILSLPSFENSNLLMKPRGAFLSTHKLQLNKDDHNCVCCTYRSTGLISE